MFFAAIITGILPFHEPRFEDKIMHEIMHEIDTLDTGFCSVKYCCGHLLTLMQYTHTHTHTHMHTNGISTDTSVEYFTGTFEIPLE